MAKLFFPEKCLHRRDLLSKKTFKKKGDSNVQQIGIKAHLDVFLRTMDGT